jgi:hypothetical protein
MGWQKGPADVKRKSHGPFQTGTHHAGHALLSGLEPFPSERLKSIVAGHRKRKKGRDAEFGNRCSRSNNRGNDEKCWETEEACQSGENEPAGAEPGE